MALSFKLPTRLGHGGSTQRMGTMLISVKEYFRYHGVLAPLIRLMRNVDFRYKALLVAAAFALPTSFVVSQQLIDQWNTWQHARLQRLGWHYVQQLDQLTTTAIARRTALESQTSTQVPSRDNKIDHDLEQAYLSLSNLQDESGDRLNSSTQWSALSSAYVRLHEDAAPTQQRTELHNQFVQAAQSLAQAVSEGARLTLHANQNVHLQSELSLVHLPQLDEAISRLHANLRPMLSASERSPAVAEAVLLEAAAMQRTLSEIKAHASRLTGADQARCVRGDEPLLADGARFAQDLRAVALDASRSVDLAQVLMQNQQLHESLRTMRGGCLTSLGEALNANEARVGKRLAWLSGMVALGVLLAVYVMTAFSRVMRGGMTLIQSEVARMARGDLSSTAMARGDDEVAQTLRNLRASLSKLADLFTVVRRGVASVSHASGDISSASEALAQRIQEATEAMAGLQQGISMTLDYLEANQQCVAQAVDRARDVTADAGRSRRAMGQLADVIESLQHRSSEIGKIVSLIDGIAFQTNLLALNASVEAAKAGSAGKGFGVVASEVRGLAQRVSEAAAQINQVVSDSTNEIALGQEIARNTVDAVHSTEANVNEMGRILTRLAEVTANGRHNAEHMTSTLVVVNENYERTSDLVMQVAHAARELRHQSLKLAEQSSKFKLG
jgi:methyl-accepting chemotaxis protein